ncbi:MAG: transglutaminase family protein [Ilumatobacteraceae bacterium]
MAIEVGRRVDVPLVGIGLPSHFLVRDGAQERYGDPFHDGARLDRAGVVAAWHRLVGDGHVLDELHLTPVSERTILIRMLNKSSAGVPAHLAPAQATALSVMRRRARRARCARAGRARPLGAAPSTDGPVPKVPIRRDPQACHP